MKSKTTKLQQECDALLQEINRLENPQCEVCGKPTQVGHHFHPKSVSNALRYDFNNLIPLCNGCHMRHHQAGDPTIHGTIIKKRGQEWYDTLTKRRWQETIKVSVGYYEEVRLRLRTMLETL